MSGTQRVRALWVQDTVVAGDSGLRQEAAGASYSAIWPMGSRFSAWKRSSVRPSAQ